jgi:hypothetical protein
MDLRRPSFLLVLAVSATLTGCHKGSARLSGHWRGVSSEGSTGSADVYANAFAAKMQLDVSGDIVTITTPGGKESSHYKVLREDATTTVIAAEGDAGTDQETFTLVDPKTLKWTVVPGKAIVFAKE